MPTPSRARNPHPPLRRVVDFDIDDRGSRFAILSCGHKLREDPSGARRINSHARCMGCAAEGNLDPLPGDTGTSRDKPKFCKRCGCKLRSGQKNDYCDPCRGGG